MTATVTQSRSRRARWPWVLLVIVVVVAVLAVVAELVARAVLPGIVRSVVVDELALPADQQLDVQASGILLPQLLTGRLDELRLSSDDVTIGGITGAADVTATGVPMRGGELGSAHGTVTIGEEQFAQLLQGSALPITQIALAEPDVTVTGSVPVLGREVPVGVTLKPGAQDGDLLLTPVSVSLAGAAIDVDRLAPLLGDAGAALSEPQRVCIADRLPAGLTLTGLRVQGSKLTADLEADGRITMDESLREPGTCPR